MNRIEFMNQLERLLQNISPAEKEEALQYYNDYFNDAGVENEQDVIEALGNPAKVAETIKRDLYGTGYEESAFQKEIASDRAVVEYGNTADNKEDAAAQGGAHTGDSQGSGQAGNYGSGQGSGQGAGQAGNYGFGQGSGQGAGQGAGQTGNYGSGQGTGQTGSYGSGQGAGQTGNYGFGQGAGQTGNYGFGQGSGQGAGQNAGYTGSYGSSQGYSRAGSYGTGESYSQSGSYSGYGGYGSTQVQPAKKTSTGMIVLIVLICVLASPVLVSVAAGVISLVVGLVTGWFGLIIGFGITAIVLFIVMFCLIGVGIAGIIISPAGAVGMVGGGLVCGGIGVLFLMLTVGMAGVATPAIIKWIYSLIRGRRKAA